MDIGFSSYSFLQNLSNGSMSILDVIDWVAAHGGKHLELATVSPNAEGNIDATVLLDLSNPLLQEIKTRAANAGIVISNIAIGANFADPNTYDENLETVKKYIDAAEYLGCNRLRHDVLEWGFRTNDPAEVERLFPILAKASRDLAAYAAPKGITTSVENHGMFMNHPDRLLRLHQLVGAPNFKITLDIGNFLCVDANPLSAVIDVLPYASIVHAKDFYIRDRHHVAPGMLATHGEQHLLGSIIGYGDLDVAHIISTIKNSGYDGLISIEFEGLEDCLKACELGIKNLTTMWEATS